MNEHSIKYAVPADESRMLFRFPDEGELLPREESRARKESLSALAEATLWRSVGRIALAEIQAAMSYCAYAQRRPMPTRANVEQVGVPLLIALARRDRQSVSELQTRHLSAGGLNEPLEALRAVGLVTSEDDHGVEVFSLILNSDSLDQ